MIAEVTLTKGKSYRIRGMKFRVGKTQPVRDSSLIRKLQDTPAFTVFVKEPEKAVKEPEKVVRKLKGKKAARKKVLVKKRTPAED